jgi:hypothetical protein
MQCEMPNWRPEHLLSTVFQWAPQSRRVVCISERICVPTPALSELVNELPARTSEPVHPNLHF